MLSTGLVSITFRKLEPLDIVKLVSQAGLKGIEWGGDIHVPHGNVERAREVAKMTEDYGLEIAAYGSYYRVGCEGNEGIPSFAEVLETAVELKAPVIRVWAGDKGSAQADESWWQQVIEDSRRIADMAANHNIVIAYEYHGGTLTDTNNSAYRLIREVNHPNIRSYWQPPVDQDELMRMEGLSQISPWLQNLHVFHWQGRERRPLDEGRTEWTKYIEFAQTLPGHHFAMLEFVKDDDPQQFLKDAEVLKQLVR